MKTRILYGMLLLLWGSLSACQGSDRAATGADTLSSHDTSPLVTTSLTDSTGKQLNLAFDNAAGTATLILDGDTIHLTQDTMASGVRYSNENYEYAEHQGNVTLTKDGEPIFRIGH